MLTADYTNKFKKEYELAIKRGLDISLLDAFCKKHGIKLKYAESTVTV